MQEASDLELVRGVRSGSPDCYRLLVERYQALVYTIALRVVQDRSEAEDLAQEVFLKAFRTLDSFREEASFKTWLCRIATNCCIDWRRKHQPQKERTEQVEAMEQLAADAEGRPEQILLRKESQAEVRRVLEQMPEKYRSILLMYHFQGMSYKDIAEAEQISPRTVETRLYRAKHLLRIALGAGAADAPKDSGKGGAGDEGAALGRRRDLEFSGGGFG